MQKFEYHAKDEKNQTVKGLVEAQNQSQAVKILRERGFLVINLRPQKKAFSAQVEGSFFSRVGQSDQVNFTRQLATMTTAGLQLTDALTLLEAQSRPAMSQIIGEVLREVQSGRSLAAAFKKHPDVFDQVYVAMIEAGESAGVLDKILNRLADNLEKQKEFRGKIISALIYPVIVIIGMILVAAIMILFVVPKMSMIYQEFEIDLPATTRFLIALSDFASNFWWLGLILIVALIFLRKPLKAAPGFKRTMDTLMFKLPIMGKLRTQMMLTEFARTLGLLIGAGVLVVDALEIVQGSLSSQIYAEAVKTSTKEVQKGMPVAAALAKTNVFPPLMSQMMAVGEETGKIDEVLLKVSSYFEQEASLTIKGLTTAMEPIIMVILGVGVAFLIISIIMPIYNLTSQF